MTDRKRKRGGKGLLVALAVILVLAAGAAVLIPKTIREMEYKSYPVAYSELVEKYSGEFGVDESVIYAVIKTESGFRPDVVSSAEARGLMQMIRESFEWSQYRYGNSEQLDFDAAFDPETNIKYGTYILKLLYDEFGDWDLVFAAYHAGRGNVSAWLENPAMSPDGKTLKDIPADTRHYINKVNKAIQMYKKLYQI